MKFSVTPKTETARDSAKLESMRNEIRHVHVKKMHSR